MRLTQQLIPAQLTTHKQLIVFREFETYLLDHLEIILASNSRL